MRAWAFVRIQRHSRVVSVSVAIAFGLLWLVVVGLHSAVRTRADDVGDLHYPAGWNIVAVPSGTALNAAIGSQYAFGPLDGEYQVLGPGEIIAGRAVWAYFPQDTIIHAGKTSATYSRTLPRPEQWVLIGNPSTTQTLPISGATQALAYDPTRGYYAVTQLQPGQGAWALSEDGGDIVVGTLPHDGATEARSLQVNLTAHPTDSRTFTSLANTAGELVKKNAFDQLQALIDDSRAAFQDGLRGGASAPLPPISADEARGIATTREDVAQAQEAMSAATQQQALNDARSAADQIESTGVRVARSTAVPSTAEASAQPEVTIPAGVTPAELAVYGRLWIAGIPARGLGIPPAGAVTSLSNSILAGDSRYAGTTTGGGFVAFTVNPAGTAINTFHIETPPLEGSSCSFFFRGDVPAPIAIVNGLFSRVYQTTDPYHVQPITNQNDLEGRFVSITEAQGTLNSVATNTPSGINCLEDVSFQAHFDAHAVDTPPAGLTIAGPAPQPPPEAPRSITLIQSIAPGGMPGGIITPPPAGFWYYVFRISGQPITGPVGGLDGRGVTVDPAVPFSWGRTNDPNVIFVGLPPQTPAGTYTVRVQLPDGSVITTTFQHPGSQTRNPGARLPGGPRASAKVDAGGVQA